jgi:hypothetical protein
MHKRILIAVALTIALSTVVYGFYWIAKHISYHVFYRDLVEQTVRDMVKSESLRGS